jgi:hypothetical protein
VDFDGPVQSFACAVVAVERCCPWALEIGIFCLPDVVWGVYWTVGLGCVGTVVLLVHDFVVRGKSGSGEKHLLRSDRT